MGRHLGGLTVHYDHAFAAVDDATISLDWTVSLSGAGSRLARTPFAAIYGRNVDRGIPRLQDQLTATT